MKKGKSILKKALEHQNTDKVAIDFGATSVTSMHVSIISGLRDYYGLEKRPVKVVEPYQMLGEVDSELIELIGIDVTSAGAKNNMFGFPNENYKPFTLDSGLEVLVPKKFNTIKNEKGDTFIFPEGNMNANPSGKMPKGGFFFDTIVRQNHFDEDNLNPEDNLEEFKILSNEDLEYMEKQVDKAYSSNLGVVFSPGGMGLGDIALVPAPFSIDPKGIRSVDEWYMATAIYQDYIHEIFEKQIDIALINLQKINEKFGEKIDVLFVCGTDFGTQISTFCSKQTFEDLYFPYYKKINDFVHKNTNWKTFKHSCGAIYDFMPLLIDSGFDIINPVQTSASGMDPTRLKKEFGREITFWGGGIDTQKILPFGSSEEVKREVSSKVEILGRDGGFVFNAIHNIQAKTPIENVATMIETLRSINNI